jgi:hypothetical protein
MLSIDKLWARVRSVLQFRIKRWHVSMRGWEKDVRVLICLEDSIWYWAALEWLFWDIGTWVCHWSDLVKVPKFVRSWKRVWDREEEACTFEEWYGDSIHSIWHCNVCDPCLQWVWRHKDFFKAWPQFEMTLAEAREKFAHDPEVWQWVEKELAEHKAHDAERAARELAENQQ